MKQADVTILMSVRNGGSLLKEAINSVLNQSYHNFIFLILDDGSTDQSWTIINSFKDKRIQAKRYTENLGLTKRLKQGVAVANSKYLARMDSDDICAKDRLEKQRDFMEENIDCAAVGSNFIRRNARGKELYRSSLPLENQSIKQSIFNKNPFKHASLFFRLDALKEIGDYDESFKYSQDYDLMLRMNSKYNTANLAQPLITDVFTLSAISQQHRFEQSYYVLKSQIKALMQDDYPVRNIVYLPRTVLYVLKSAFFSLKL